MKLPYVRIVNVAIVQYGVVVVILLNSSKEYTCTDMKVLIVSYVDLAALVGRCLQKKGGQTILRKEKPSLACALTNLGSKMPKVSSETIDTTVYKSLTGLQFRPLLFSNHYREWFDMINDPAFDISPELYF